MTDRQPIADLYVCWNCDDHDVEVAVGADPPERHDGLRLRTVAVERPAFRPGGVGAGLRGKNNQSGATSDRAKEQQQ